MYNRWKIGEQKPQVSINAWSLNGTMHAEKQAETGCTLGFALDYYFSQVTNFIVHILKLVFFSLQ